MLALHWAALGSKGVLRLHFLPTLLHEAYDFLHYHLCAGALGRKLFMLPFHRDVELTVRIIRACFDPCFHCQGKLK
jgi:hypothetical protein